MSKDAIPFTTLLPNLKIPPSDVMLPFACISPKTCKLSLKVTLPSTIIVPLAVILLLTCKSPCNNILSPTVNCLLIPMPPSNTTEPVELVVESVKLIL